MEAGKGAVVQPQELAAATQNYFVGVRVGGRQKEGSEGEAGVRLGEGRGAGTTVPKRHSAGADRKSQGCFRGQLVTIGCQQCEEKQHRCWETTFVPS